MGFTPKRLRRQIRAAMERVEARGERPPWKKHPDLVTLTIAIANDLSTREARQVRNHLAMCKVCRERREQLARDLKRPVSSRVVAKTLRHLKQLEREGASEASKARG